MLLIFVGSCALAAATQAQNLNFLRNSVMANFQQDDTDLMRKNANEVLESPDANARKEWSNPRTGASGSAQVVGQFTASDAAPCKRLRLVNRAAQQHSQSTHTMCRYEGRGWILNPDAKPAT
jgi:hypothetical protein